MSTLDVKPHFEFLTEHGFSIRRYAMLIGTAERTLRYWVQDRKEIPVNTASMLATCLRYEAQQLIKHAENIERQLKARGR